MVAEPSNPKGQGPLVRAPGFQVMWTFMAFVLMAADGGGDGELGAFGMAESFVNMPEEPKAEEHHRKSCRKFEAYDGHQGEGQQGVQQIEKRADRDKYNRSMDACSYMEKYNKPTDKTRK